LGAGEHVSRRGESGLTVRQEDIVASFVAAVDRIIELRPDICLHAGDLFHQVRPLNRILAIAAEQLHRLAARAGIPTVIISGNHDAPRQAYVGAPLDVLRPISNLHVAARGELEIFTIGSCRVFALPHCLSTRDMHQQLQACIPDPGSTYNVLVTHGVIAGMPEFSMADLGETEIPRDVLERFDYAALGHYHNYRVIGARACYAGSTDRLSIAERDEPKGFVEVELDPLRIHFHEIAGRAMIDLPRIDATGQRGDQLVELIEKQLVAADSAEKIVRVRIDGLSPETLKTLPVQALAALKERVFSLDLQFNRSEGEEASPGFGRSAIGRLDLGFMEFLEQADLTGLDKKRLADMAQTYLGQTES